MDQALQFAFLGLATGAVYAVLAQGVVLVYRGSGILNFSQGAMALAGAYTYYWVSVRQGMPLGVGLLAALVLCAGLGALLHLFILKPMRESSPLARVMVTIGVVITFQSLGYLLFGQYPLKAPSILPTRTLFLFNHQVPVGLNSIFIIVIGVGLTIGLAVFYRYTAAGRLTASVANNPLVTASFGHSPDAIAAANWALGSALAGVAGILIAPILGLEPVGLVLLIVPAMSAALVGSFTSFPVTLITALVLGLAGSEITGYVTQPGWSLAAPFFVVIAVLLIRGKGLPLRGYVLDRLPRVGNGRVRILPVLVLYAVLVVVMQTVNPTWVAAIAATAAYGVICLSVVVITGYGGQLSLAQYIIAGLGALLAARLSLYLPFLAAVVVAVLITCAVGMLIGIPALRTRGATLAIVTLGLAGVIVDVVFDNLTLSGGVSGIQVGVPTFFGYSLNPFTHTNRYGIFVLTVAVLLGLAVANLRRGLSGRRLLATRSNERAAASLGIRVAVVKLYAFTLGAAVAALGGIMLAFIQPNVNVGNFDLFTSLFVVGVTVVGGIGFVSGAALGSLLITGGVLSQAFSGWSAFNEYLPLIGGIALILNLRFAPDGMVFVNRQLMAPLTRRYDRAMGALGAKVLAPLHNRRRRPAATAATPAAANIPADGAAIQLNEAIVPVTLSVRGLSVAFGGVHAVRDVDIEVRPGEVHGLIGPNGAGKTTLIDAITGFVRTQEGSVTLGDVELSGWTPARRAEAGLSRSFQSLELFTDLSVQENIAVASERSSPVRYLSDLVKPGKLSLSPIAAEVMRQFELTELKDRRIQEIPFGQRKLVAIARSVARAPAILLLDEPAAGLDDGEAMELAGVIRQLAREWGMGVLLVEHKVDMVMSISDRVTVLVGGSVLTSGSPNQVSADPAVLDAYLGSPDEEARPAAAVAARGGGH